MDEFKQSDELISEIETYEAELEYYQNCNMNKFQIFKEI